MYFSFLFAFFFTDAETLFVLFAHFLMCDMLPFHLREDSAECDRNKGEKEKREGEAVKKLFGIARA